MYTVKDVMTGHVATIGAEATIDEAISSMLDRGVSGLPVVDDEGRLLGVISEIDIINLIYEADISRCTVGDFMSKHVTYLEAEASLDDAAELFCTKSLRRIPIVREERLVGNVSRRDLIRFVRDVRNRQAGVWNEEVTENSQTAL